MANRGLRRPLTREALEGLLANPSSQRFLPEIHLALPHGPGEHTTLSCRLMYVRLNGFMLIIPNHSDVPHVAIEALKEPGSEEQPLFQPGACLLETLHGRELTEEPVQLVDLTWTYVGHFTLPHFGQHAVPRDQVLGFMPGDSTCRPRLAEAQGLAADWLVSMDATTAQEYLTGEEFMDEGEDVDPPPAPEPEPQLVSQLQARIAELETRLQDRSTAVQPAPVAAPPQMKAPLLFPGGTPPNVSTADWAKLQTLAGSPPPRVSSAETRRKTVPLQVAQLEHAFADLNREADEAEEVNLELPPDLKTSDPMHRLMFLQMQQNSVLLKKLTAAKTQDPVLGALSGGGGGDSAPASSSGVKGCMARDAYVRAVQDLAKVSEVTRVNLLKELGIHSSQETGSLLRKYVERKIPLAEHRLLSQFAFMISEAWMIGFNSQNVELLGILSKMLFFVEQCAIDQGRSQVAWLLTGWQEPPYQILVSGKKRTSLQQFCKLCHPAWIAANLAFLKDLDYLESRVQAVHRPVKNSKPDEEDDQPKIRKPKPQKGKGRGKGQVQPQNSSDTTEA